MNVVHTCFAIYHSSLSTAQYKYATRRKHLQCKISSARLQYETISGVLDLDDCGVCPVPGIRNVKSVVVNADAVKQLPPPPPPPPPLPPPQPQVEKDATSWTQFHLNSKI
ncbi:hypothetical protein ALC53_00687 [Atta colombica]|uniref:Uncharacterized protein n=1 Tax=Atta colombica TaxID=520822 RepID=A0A195BWT7_9HYME|nr:hypothetical protein ALC53_00687 [Atta colombica]